MKRLIMALVALMILVSTQAFAQDVSAKVEAGMKDFFRANQIPYEVKVEVIQKIKEPKGLYYIKMTIKDPKSGRSQEQFVFTDGKYVMPDILTVAGNESLKDKLTFDNAKKVDLDLSKLTLMEGNKNAKHVIVKVSDFQCPYCKRAFAYLHNEIKRRNLDVAIYMMHLPLDFHQKARLYAAIFEAGKMMGKSFGPELYATNKQHDEMNDNDLIDIFAKKSGNPAKFKNLVKSPSVAGKITMQAQMANAMGITGTPHIFFDGKPVGGFKQSLYKLALDRMK